MKNESHDRRIARVTQQLSAALKKQAAGRWGAVRTAGRGEAGRYAWRFAHADGSRAHRFLRVTHKAMLQSANPLPVLLAQLQAGRWLDRLNGDSETSLVLRAGGQLENAGRK